MITIFRDNGPDRVGWHALDATTADYRRLPPDLTGWAQRNWRVDCPARRPGVWCTRPAGHTGRHAAGDGVKILAVWS